MNLFGNSNLGGDNHKSLLDQFPKKRNLQRYIQVLSGLALSAASSVVLGLGLGDIEPKSFLGQPLAANIELISLDGDIDPESLIVRQVTRIEAEKMGVDIFHTGYRFDLNVDNSSGRPVVTVMSKKSINEPYLNLLVELRWPSGVVYREYPILLDPPPLIPVSSLESKSQSVESKPAVRRTAQKPSRSKASRPNTRTPVTAGGASLSAQEGGSYKVQSGDTLWQIAKDLSQGTALSINETMAWVHENNSKAFSNGNMNRLKSGASLKIPDMSTLDLEDKLMSSPARGLADETAAPLEPVTAQGSSKELDFDERESVIDPSERAEAGLLVVNSEHIEDQSREMIDLLTRENEDLKDRMSKVENSEYLDTLKKLVALQKRQISELRSTLGVRDTSSEEMSALLEKVNVDIDSGVNTLGSADVEVDLSAVDDLGEASEELETAPEETSLEAAKVDEISIAEIEPPLTNPPEAEADKSLVTWLVVGAGAFLAMIFAFLFIYYRKMLPVKGPSEDSDDYQVMGQAGSGSFYSSSDKDDSVAEERAPDIGYDGEEDPTEYQAEEEGDWLGEKVDDVEAFDAGAFDSAIQEVEDIFESISLDENALDGLDEQEEDTHIKGRSEDDVRSSIAEKMSQYNPTDFKTGADSLGLLEIDDAAEGDEESDEVDATVNRAKMFCEFSQFDRAQELIEKTMGEIPDARYAAALDYVQEKRESAQDLGEDVTQVEGFNTALDDDSEEEMLGESHVGDFSRDSVGGDVSMASSIQESEESLEEPAAVLMDKFEGDIGEELAEDAVDFSESFNLDDTTEVLANDEDVLSSDFLEVGTEDDLDLELDVDIDFEDVDFERDIHLEDELEGKKKPVSC